MDFASNPLEANQALLAAFIEEFKWQAQKCLADPFARDDIRRSHGNSSSCVAKGPLDRPTLIAIATCHRQNNVSDLRRMDLEFRQRD